MRIMPGTDLEDRVFLEVLEESIHQYHSNIALAQYFDCKGDARIVEGKILTSLIGIKRVNAHVIPETIIIIEPTWEEERGYVQPSLKRGIINLHLQDLAKLVVYRHDLVERDKESRKRKLKVFWNVPLIENPTLIEAWWEEYLSNSRDCQRIFDKYDIQRPASVIG